MKESTENLINWGVILAVVGFAALAMSGCSHGSPNPSSASVHDAAGCLAGCPGASVVETSPDGDKCRCWSHKVGVQYTFAYPDSEEKLAYAQRRWLHAVGIAQGCKLQGLGWESTPDGSELQCVRYDGPPSSELLKRIAWELPAAPARVP